MQLGDKEKYFNKLSQALDDYRGTTSIEQTIPYTKLRNMNMDLLVSVIKDTSSDIKNASKVLTRMSYAELLAGNSKISINEGIVRDMWDSLGWLSRDERVHVMSIMLKISRDNIIKIIETTPGIYLPFSPARHITLTDLHNSGVGFDMVKGGQMQLSSTIEALLSTSPNRCIVNVTLTSDNIHLSEKFMIENTSLVTYYNVILTGTVVEIDSRYSNIANLFMRFQLYASTGTVAYGDYINNFINMMETMLEFANMPQIKDKLDTLHRNKFGTPLISDIDDDTLFQLYSSSIDNFGVIEQGSSTVSSLVNNDDWENYNVTRIDTHTWVAISQDQSFNFGDVWNINIEDKDMSIIESMQTSLLDNIYCVLSNVFPKYIDKLSNVHVKSCNNKLSLHHKEVTIGVYLGDETTMTINNSVFIVNGGTLIVLSSSNAEVSFEDGHYVWYVS